MHFREWAKVVLGEEAGDKLADNYANALGRALDRTILYGTETPDVTKYEDLKCPRCQSDACPGRFAPEECLAIQPGQPITEPCIAIPEGYDGTDAEAVGLAVAGAVAAIAQERDTWRFRTLGAYHSLKKLADMYPRTSFAGPEAAVELAQAHLQELAQALGLEPESGT